MLSCFQNAFPLKKKALTQQSDHSQCIAKGKVHKRYEFGCKVVLVTTRANNWIVGAAAVHSKPYDGTTLSDVIAQTN
mgnify:CR=1 FL=1